MKNFFYFCDCMSEQHDYEHKREENGAFYDLTVSTCHSSDRNLTSNIALLQAIFCQKRMTSFLKELE